MSNHPNSACPLWLFNSKNILVGFIFDVLYYVRYSYSNVVFRSSIIIFLVSGVVKLAVSYGA